MTDRTTRHLLEPRPLPRLLSLVIPLYNEESAAPFLRAEVERFLDTVGTRTEVLLVNDGSSDDTLAVIVAWSQADPRVKVIHLSRNFGHQLAATAGLEHATGDAVVLIDADLQDPLAVIHTMLDRYREGYDVVYGQRERRRGETAFKRFTAWAFYRLMRKLVYKDLPVDTGDFRLISRPCLDALNSMQETHRFLRGMVAWVGYPQIAVRYERAARVSGESKYPLRKMLAFAWTAATSFSIIPLQVSLLLGVVIGLFAIEEGVRAVMATLLGWYAVPGWTSLMVVTSIIGSALLISIGILGQYIGKVFEQSNQRPLYVVARTFNLDQRHDAAASGQARARDGAHG
ncbi:MAG TPA: glycosyltransferase family 2 protein [Bryobacteraceae bacterium]|nr:glycosyltransferase family 2 protein [Bryobacteraceae bacterium]